jgi:hypothetical protein
VALLEARSCDLHARHVIERVLLGASTVDLDRGDTTRSEQLLVIADQFGQAGANRLCTSMGTGPAVTDGYDIVLTEVVERDRHYFVAQAGTRKGADVLSDMHSAPAGEAELAVAAAAPARAAARITRSLATDGIREFVYRTWRISAGRTPPIAAWRAGTTRRCVPRVFARRPRIRPTSPARRSSGVSAGFVVHRRLLVHERPDRPSDIAVALPPVDDPQLASFGSISSEAPAAWAVGATSRGARWESTSLRKHARSAQARRRIMQPVDELITTSSVFQGMDDRHLRLIAELGRPMDIEADRYLFRAGAPADTFWLIRSGTIALELHSGALGQMVMETFHNGEPVGWSWLFEPYRLQFDGRATEPSSLVAFDAARLRAKCEEDHELGYQLIRRFAAHMAAALVATRIQLLDVTGGAR